MTAARRRHRRARPRRAAVDRIRQRQITDRRRGRVEQLVVRVQVDGGHRTGGYGVEPVDRSVLIDEDQRLERAVLRAVAAGSLRGQRAGPRRRSPGPHGVACRVGRPPRRDLRRVDAELIRRRSRVEGHCGRGVGGGRRERSAVLQKPKAGGRAQRAAVVPLLRVVTRAVRPWIDRERESVALPAGQAADRRQRRVDQARVTDRLEPRRGELLAGLVRRLGLGQQRVELVAVDDEVLVPSHVGQAAGDVLVLHGRSGERRDRVERDRLPRLPADPVVVARPIRDVGRVRRPDVGQLAVSHRAGELARHRARRHLAEVVLVGRGRAVGLHQPEVVEPAQRAGRDLRGRFDVEVQVAEDELIGVLDALTGRGCPSHPCLEHVVLRRSRRRRNRDVHGRIAARVGVDHGLRAAHRDLRADHQAVGNVAAVSVGRLDRDREEVVAPRHAECHGAVEEGRRPGVPRGVVQVDHEDRAEGRLLAERVGAVHDQCRLRVARRDTGVRRRAADLRDPGERTVVDGSTERGRIGDLRVRVAGRAEARDRVRARRVRPLDLDLLGRAGNLRRDVEQGRVELAAERADGLLRHDVGVSGRGEHLHLPRRRRALDVEQCRRDLPVRVRRQLHALAGDQGDDARRGGRRRARLGLCSRRDDERRREQERRRCEPETDQGPHAGQETTCRRARSTCRAVGYRPSADYGQPPSARC